MSKCEKCRGLEVNYEYCHGCENSNYFKPNHRELEGQIVELKEVIKKAIVLLAPMLPQSPKDSDCYIIREDIRIYLQNELSRIG